ncbi:MAG: hypothetical protein J2P26_06440, partial [Nocardiopsaceae bacterium]|nr:hypothetical protein [Nocardiopsaceae bacterium]
VWLFYGALVASLYGTKEAIIGIAVSVAAFGIVSPVYVGWAARTGLSSALISRRMFGVVGSALIALLVAATTTYYTVFESSTLADALRVYTGALDIKWWYLIVTVAVIPLALGRVQSWMAKFNSALLPFFLAGMAATVVATIVKRGAGTHPLLDPAGHSTGKMVNWFTFPGVVPDAARPLPGWLLVVVLYLGLTLTLAVGMDFGRFSKPGDVRFHRHVTMGLGFYAFTYGVNGLVGIYITQALLGVSTVEDGVVQASLDALGLVGLLFIIITQARINSLNYYLSVLNWDRVLRVLTGRRLPRIVWVSLLSLVVFLLMLTNVFSYLQTAMNWQGVCMISWVGIVLAHLVLRPSDLRNGPEFRATRLPAVTPAVAVWAIATGIGIWLLQDKGAPASLAGMPAIVVFAVSVVLYALLLLVSRRAPVAQEAAADPRDLVPDPSEARLACDICDRAYIALEMDLAGGRVVCDECATKSRFAGAALRADATRLPSIDETGTPETVTD